MTFKLLGFGLSQKSISLAEKLVKVVTAEPVEIIDLQSYPVSIFPEDILFLCGSRAANLTAQSKCKLRIELPDLEYLEKKKENKTYREQALSKLEEAKNILEEKEKEKTQNEERVRVKREDLPNINLIQLDRILQTIHEQGVSEWWGTTRKGETICVKESGPPNEKADINMTFGELYSFIGFMDYMNLKEITIVKKRKEKKND